MATTFLVGSGVLILVALFSFAVSLPLWGDRLPLWLFPIYSALLFSLSLCLWLDHLWARWPAAAMLVPFIWILWKPVLSANSGQILGGAGPDANPMAGIGVIIITVCSLFAFVATVFCVWLVTFRTSHKTD
jgi:hypothetical protein